VIKQRIMIVLGVLLVFTIVSVAAVVISVGAGLWSLFST
jgi:hypothetical protein